MEQLALGRSGDLGQFYPAPGAITGVGYLIGGHEAGQLIEPLLDLARQLGLFAKIESLVVLLHQGGHRLVINVHDVVGLRLVGVDLVKVLPVGRVAAARPGHPGTLVLFLQHRLETGRGIHQV